MARYTVVGKRKNFRTLRAALDVAYAEAVSTGRPVFVRISKNRYIRVTPSGSLAHAQRAN